MEEEELSVILHNIKIGEFSVNLFRSTLFDLLKIGKGRYIIQVLLQAEVDIVAQTSCSSPPEQIVLKTTHEIIVLLLANSIGNSFNFYSTRKQTVLHFASKYGWLDVVQSLLKKGADPNVKEVDGYTPIIFATHSLHEDVVELLIESGADVLCCSNKHYTLLHAASKNGWLELVRFLLNKGADPNADTNSGMTPLDFAVKSSHKDVVALLVKYGANVTECILEGALLLRRAVSSCDLEILQYLVESGDLDCLKISPLLTIACLTKKIETIEYLVKVFNMKTGRCDTPLNCVISRCKPNLELVGIFLERGGYLDVYDYNRVLKNKSLKVGILQNIQICTQAIINKFNNKDLPDLYKLPMSVEKFPPIEKLMIKSQGIIQDIAESVRNEIETNGFCNLMNARSIVLSMMSVKSYIDFYDKSQSNKSATADPVNQYPFPSKLQCLNCGKSFDMGYLDRFNHDCELDADDPPSPTGIRKRYCRSKQYLQIGFINLKINILSTMLRWIA